VRIYLGRRPRRLLTAVGVTGLVVGVAALPGLADASTGHAAAAAGWRVVARTDSALSTIVAASSGSAWALGAKAGPSNAALPAGVDWHGHHWTAVSFPKAVTSGIACAAASSPGNVWAFAGAGIFGGPASYAGALRLTSGKWVVSKSFTPAGLVSGCSVFSPTDAWVYGLAHVAPGVGTWRLHGRTWRAVPHTGNFDVATASAVAADDIWAIAAGPAGINNVVAHWNGRSWSADKAFAAALPAESSKVFWYLTAINAVGHGNVWISVEISRNGGAATEFVLHFSGGQWYYAAKTNVGYYLPAAVSDGHGGWWAPGPTGPLPPATSPYVLHETHGHWVHVPLPVVPGTVLQLTQIVHVPGTNAMLAIAQLLSGTPVLRSVVLAYGNLPK
jgi:hypothetical protein